MRLFAERVRPVIDGLERPSSPTAVRSTATTPQHPSGLVS
jgi:hypothetical protein